MRRSKIFLSVTTCLLAIAGVAATKAAKFGSTTVTYFTQIRPLGGPHSCVKIIQQPCAYIPMGDRCYGYTLGGTLTTFPLYTGINNNVPCSQPIQYYAF